MAKKTIKDLKIGDTIYRYSGGIKECQVTLLSRERLETNDSNIDYFQILIGDETRFQFETIRYSTKFYLNHIDALKERRKHLDERMLTIFKEQQDFYKKVTEVNNAIRRCDEAIACELKNKSE